jgi:hypothetical protein
MAAELNLDNRLMYTAGAARHGAEDPGGGFDCGPASFRFPEEHLL